MKITEVNRTEMWSRDLPNMKQECQPLNLGVRSVLDACARTYYVNSRSARSWE
jgi:hypothetical protein